MKCGDNMKSITKTGILNNMKKRMKRATAIFHTKNDISLEQQEQREFDECMEKINQPNRTSFNTNDLPQILQDMVNGVYRDDVRIDPFRSRPKRKK